MTMSPASITYAWESTLRASLVFEILSENEDDRNFNLGLTDRRVFGDVQHISEEGD